YYRPRQDPAPLLGGRARLPPRRPAAAPRPATRRARHGVPAARVGGAAEDPLREHPVLCRDRPWDRQPEGDPGGGASVRDEPRSDRDPVPPRGKRGWGPRRLSVGTGPQKSPSAEGGRDARRPAV